MVEDAPASSALPVEAGPQEALLALAGVACTNTALRRAARRLGQLYDEALAPIGLTAAQSRLLWEISGAGRVGQGRDLTLQALAGRLAVQTSALTHALKPLLRDGLVALQPDARDRRIKHAVLTRSGEAKLGQMATVWLDANARVEAALGRDSAARLRELADAVSSPAFLGAYAADAESVPQGEVEA